MEPLVLIANAIIEYNEAALHAGDDGRRFNTKITNALNYLKKVVDYNPKCPADVWLGIGICYFKLNNYIKAKFALEHVLELDPENSMALTSLGITEIQLNPSDLNQRKKAVLRFQKSFEIDDTNPLTMKHLADHFFFDGELDIAEALCIRALKFCEKLKKPNDSELP